MLFASGKQKNYGFLEPIAHFLQALGSVRTETLFTYFVSFEYRDLGGKMGLKRGH